MNKKQFPLSLLKDTEALLIKLRQLEAENSDLIRVVTTEGVLLKFVDNDENSSFYFSVYNPHQDSSYQSLFTLKYSPYSLRTIKNEPTSTVSQNRVVENFANWIAMLEEYNSVNIRHEDYFTQQYQEEFYHEFEIVDDDANTMPFEHERQILIYKLLNDVEIKLKKEPSDDDEIADIIKEVGELKSNIQNLNKKRTVKKLSRIFAKIKKKGLKLFLEILDEAKKEMIKRALTGGFDEVKNILHNF